MTAPLYDALIRPHLGSERPFLHLADGTSRSYAACIAEANRLANLLDGAGVAPGDRVLVQVSKSPEALSLCFACIAAGAVFLPLNPAYTGAEVAYFISDAEPKLVVCDPADQAQIQPLAAGVGARLETLGADGSGSLMASAMGLPESFEPLPRGPDDLAAMLYTSGTTGRSKGAMLTQENLRSNAAALVEAWAFGPEDVLYHALPIFHTHGLFVATNVMLLAGGQMLFEPKFSAERAVELLPRATTIMGVPTFYTRLLAEPRFNADLTRHMRLFVSGSAPLLAQTHREFEARTGHRILERYGMTETGMNTSNPYGAERRAGSVGFPLPGIEARIMGETGELPPGETGMIEVRGPNVFKGYWRMPEKTSEELRPDGFFITGDLGRIDGDGYLHIVGRGKDLIISGGFNVYPKEVETAIDALPGVVESAVIGVPHPDFGEGVVAVVVGEISPEAVIAGVASDLAKFKQPKHVMVVAELPRNSMGKVQKKSLREEYAGLFQPADA